jgi:uncharacterized membrane protein
MARKLKRRLPRPTLIQILRGNFLTGLVIVLPIFLTIYVVYVLVGIVDARVIPLIPNQYNPQNVFGRNIFGFGLVIFLAFTTAIGAMTKGFFGARLITFGEGLVDRTPIVRSIYNALKQIVETMLSQSGTSFQHACLIEYPRKGIWSVAFIATAARGEIGARWPELDLLSVFLPTTPNPTSGFLLYVPRADVFLLDMSIEEAAKLVISAGLVAPPHGEPVASPTRAPARARPSPAPNPPSAKITP